MVKPLFGMPLEEHLQMMGRDISLVLEACILTLLETGMEEEVVMCIYCFQWSVFVPASVYVCVCGCVEGCVCVCPKFQV